jgi:hypothetical protein
LCTLLRNGIGIDLSALADSGANGMTFIDTKCAIFIYLIITHMGYFMSNFPLISHGIMMWVGLCSNLACKIGEEMSLVGGPLVQGRQVHTSSISS